jgi:hypothetical protein
LSSDNGLLVGCRTEASLFTTNGILLCQQKQQRQGNQTEDMQKEEAGNTVL